MIINKLRQMFQSIKFFFQRLFRGWDDRETWNLDYQFYKWLYPRLKRFRKLSLTCPGNKTCRDWDLEIEMILKAMEAWILNEERFFSETKRVEDAKKTVNHWFFKNIRNLYW